MLCGICDHLEIVANDFIIKPEDDTSKFDESHDLGTLHEIRQRAHYCPSCCLFVEAIGASEHPSSQLEKNIQCQLYWMSEGFVSTEEGPTVRCLRLSAQPWPHAFNEFNRLTILAEDAPDGHRLFFSRKIPSERLSVKLIKKWVKSCQRWHGEDCEEPLTKSVLEMPPNFRVIDTWARCVVQAPPHCRYLTLSYVWGPIEVFKLTSSNIKMLAGPGGLKKVWHCLPTTIQDAITLTSSLSERYIWIDSMCIIQDDDADKRGLIPHMDLIYDRGFMTIVAATGDNANAGLPGVRKKSRSCVQMVEELRPSLRLTCPKHLTDLLNNSVYESRGWTYQERCLSRRCLVFAHR